MSMKLIGLVSGGKDSIYAIVEAIRRGHEVPVLANLRPFPESDSPLVSEDAALEEDAVEDLDSYMFQTVGHTTLPAIAKAMGKPLLRGYTTGKSYDISLEFKFAENMESKGSSELTSTEKSTSQDEIEDLYNLLRAVVEKYPEVQGVTCGAILSNYQRQRVEIVCKLLGLVPFSFLWHRQQRSVLDDMSDSGMHPALVKVSSFGLKRIHLGKCLFEPNMRILLSKLDREFGINIAGEGGEYETLSLDSPLHLSRLAIQDSVIQDGSRDVANLKITSLVCEEKSDEEKESMAKRLHPAWLALCRAFGSAEAVEKALQGHTPPGAPSLTPKYPPFALSRYSLYAHASLAGDVVTSNACENALVWSSSVLDVSEPSENMHSASRGPLVFLPYCGVQGHVHSSSSTEEARVVLGSLEEYLKNRTNYCITDTAQVDIRVRDQAAEHMPAILATARRFWTEKGIEPILNIAASASAVPPPTSVWVRLVLAPGHSALHGAEHHSHTTASRTCVRDASSTSVTRYAHPALGFGPQRKVLQGTNGDNIDNADNSASYVLLGTTFGLDPETLQHPQPAPPLHSCSGSHNPFYSSLSHVFSNALVGTETAVRSTPLVSCLSRLLPELRRLALTLSHQIDLAEQSWMHLHFSEFFLAVSSPAQQQQHLLPEEVHYLKRTIAAYLLTWAAGFVGSSAKVTLLDLAQSLEHPEFLRTLESNQPEDCDSSSSSSDTEQEDSYATLAASGRFSPVPTRRGITLDKIRQSNYTEYNLEAFLDPAEEFLFGPVRPLVPHSSTYCARSEMRSLMNRIRAFSKEDYHQSKGIPLDSPIPLLAFPSLDGIDLVLFLHFWEALDKERTSLDEIFAIREVSSIPFGGHIHCGMLVLSNEAPSDKSQTPLYKTVMNILESAF